MRGQRYTVLISADGTWKATGPCTAMKICLGDCISWVHAGSPWGAAISRLSAKVRLLTQGENRLTLRQCKSHRRASEASTRIAWYLRDISSDISQPSVPLERVFCHLMLWHLWLTEVSARTHPTCVCTWVYMHGTTFPHFSPSLSSCLDLSVKGDPLIYGPLLALFHTQHNTSCGRSVCIQALTQHR